MGELLVMEVETGEIKASHTETTVQYASKLALKHKQKQTDIKKLFPLVFLETPLEKMMDIVSTLNRE